MEKISFVWTIIFGLVIGIGANILTPFISRVLGKLSSSVNHRNERRREIFDRRVQYLISNPLDETNLRITTIGLHLASLIIIIAAMIIAFLSRTVVGMGMSILFAICCIYVWVAAHNYTRLLSEVWRRRKIKDLDFY
jgi:hypothetical protein